MSVFSDMIKSLLRPQRSTYYGAAASSAPWSRDVYEQETVRAIIDCIATHSAKAQAMHVVLDDHDRVIEIKRNSPYVKLLNQKANSIMSGYDFKYKLISQLQDKTTALSYVQWEGTRPAAFVPIGYADFDFYGIQGGGYAVKFTDLFDGKSYTLNLEDVIVLRKFYNSRECAGDGNGPIYNTLSLIKSSDEGIAQAVGVSNKVRGILKQKKSMLAPDDVKNSTEEFNKRFEEAAQKGGIIGTDSMEEFTPLNITPWATNAAQMKEIRSNLFNFWRINENILRSDYSEAQWQAFFESVLEPIQIAMGQAFTNCCFTQRERDTGNRIVFNNSLMINTSMQTKVNLVQNTKELGLLTINEQRELFGYAPVEGGDERMMSLNFIQQSQAADYQAADRKAILELIQRGQLTGKEGKENGEE